ncbi:MAG: hypothetical protein DRO98_08725 [Archaeoglobales archaeon]|nr:MAG: hypothetical protein DRO98_08725 [Archaeoglobales archaeon]
MPKNQFLIFEWETKTTSYIVGTKKVPAPCFIPEIKGDEDMEVILRFAGKAMDEGNPIMVPANRWPSFVTNARFRVGPLFEDRLNMQQLVKRHPIIFYEPPELFRYTTHRVLVSYALKGDLSRIKEFHRRLKQGNETRALELIPEFYRPFVEKQMVAIYKAMNLQTLPKKDENSHVTDAWLTKEVGESYWAHMVDIYSEVRKLPDSAIIPPVPPILQSSVEAIIKRVRAANHVTSVICKRFKGKEKFSPVPYFHLYLDWKTLLDDDIVEQIIRMAEIELKIGEYCGTVITLTGYNLAAEKNNFNKIESFITEIVNVSHQYYLPVILPRSGWYGLYLTDLGVQAFGSLLNGHSRYAPSGGKISKEDRYGKLPLIDAAVELKLSDVLDQLKKYGELPDVPGLPRKPTPDLLKDADKYRVLFSKPWRLCHCEEARRIRKGLIQGVREPAKRYLERSRHPYFGHK